MSSSLLEKNTIVTLLAVAHAAQKRQCRRNHHQQQKADSGGHLQLQHAVFHIRYEADIKMDMKADVKPMLNIRYAARHFFRYGALISDIGRPPYRISDAGAIWPLICDMAAESLMHSCD